MMLGPWNQQVNTKAQTKPLTVLSSEGVVILFCINQRLGPGKVLGNERECEGAQALGSRVDPIVNSLLTGAGEPPFMRVFWMVFLQGDGILDG